VSDDAQPSPVGEGGWVLLRRLHGLIARVNSEPTVVQTVQAVVDGVVDGVGFGFAAVYYRHRDGSFEALVVAGPPAARAAVTAQRLPADAFDLDFAHAEAWGGLRFVSHDRFVPGMVAHWIPEPAAGGDGDAWHPLDALWVPLHAPTGQLVGVLSVDSPTTGRRPDPAQRELLEMFAVQAGIAVDNARLTQQLHEEQQRLRVSEEAFRLTFDGSGMGMAMVSLAPGEVGRYLRVNGALCALTGYTAEQLLTRRTLDITHPEDTAADLAAVGEAQNDQRDTFRADKRYVRADGSVVWVAVTTSVIGRVPGEALHAISLVEDITARRVLEQDLTHRALHDPLTGLWNREAFTQRVTDAVARAARSGRAGAVLFCDLDGFKTVNDRFGHQRGDAVLTVITDRLTEQVRAVDTVARLGGDEFAVLAEDVTLDDITGLAGRLEQAVARPLPGTDGPPVTVSIGIAVLTPDSTDPHQLLHTADLAMYQAKTRGGNQHHHT